MKITEIISEMQRGRIYTGGPAVDRSAPWVQKNIKQASELTQTINSITDPGEKFKYINSLNTTSKNKVLADIDGKQRVLTVKHYDPETGNIVMSVGPNSLATYQTNASSLNYLGRERSPTSNLKYYRFLATNLDKSARPSTNKLLLKKQAGEEAIKAAHAAKQPERDAWEKQQQELVAARRNELNIDYKGIDDYDDDSFGSW